MKDTSKKTEFTGRTAEMRADSPWLASEDLLEMGDVKVTIEKCLKVTGATFDDGRKEDVFTIAFTGRKKQLVLNSVNRKALVSLYGPDVTKWKGQEITLYVTKVRAFGSYVNGIRVRLPAQADN